MKTRYSFVDPGVIVGAVVALILLAVGVYAFFTTVNSIPRTVPASASTAKQNSSYWAISNATASGSTVFNIIGIVISIGAIMAIVGIVYQYIR